MTTTPKKGIQPATAKQKVAAAKTRAQQKAAEQAQMKKNMREGLDGFAVNPGINKRIPRY